MKRRTSEYSDSELYALMSTEQSEAAFSELYVRFSANVFAYCLRVLGSRDQAYDIFQETFLRFYQSAERHANLENVRAYALTISRNLCLNEKKRLQSAAVEFDELLYNPGVTREAERTEMMELIAMALDLLPHDMREAFVLREYDGLPYQEISDMLNIKLETVKVRVFRARQKIRDILEPYLNEMSKD